MCKKIAVPKPVKNIDAPVDSCKTQIISKKIWHITISLKKKCTHTAATIQDFIRHIHSHSGANTRPS
jgi:hypothetical protein